MVVEPWHVSFKAINDLQNNKCRLLTPVLAMKVLNHFLEFKNR